MAYTPMIDPDTGEIDHALVAERAQLRAIREYGSPNFPPGFLRSATEWCMDRAHSERYDWRRSRGLPDDRVANSTIAHYGRAEEGVRRSRF